MHHGREGVASGGWSHGVHKQEAERDHCWCSASFLLIIQSGSPAYETAPPIFLVRVPSLKPLPLQTFPGIVCLLDDSKCSHTDNED